MTNKYKHYRRHRLASKSSFRLRIKYNWRILIWFFIEKNIKSAGMGVVNCIAFRLQDANECKRHNSPITPPKIIYELSLTIKTFTSETEWLAENKFGDIYRVIHLTRIPH